MEDEQGLTPEELSEKYDTDEGWGEHPIYTSWDWVQDVATRSTRRGYWDWVAAKIDGDYIGDEREQDLC